MNKIKILSILMAVVLSTTAFADENGRLQIIASLYYFVTVFATSMGIGLLILGVVRLKKRADNPNDPKSFPSAIIVIMIAGALSFNYSQSAGTMINTLLGNSDAGYCFVIDNARSSGETLRENCWDSSNSEVLDDIEERVNSMSDNAAGTKIKENAETIVALFQLIGLIYFLKGLYGLKLTAEGTAREGYGKPIITIMAAALVIDLPHTIEMASATINALGFGV